MKNGKIIVAGLIVTVCLSSLMTGCSQSTQKIYTKVDETKQIEFSWWGNDTRHQYTLDGIESFEAKNKNILVNRRYGEWSGYEKKNQVWMISNKEPDVMQINYGWLKTYSKDGQGYYDLYELSDYLDLSGYDENDLEFGMVNGKLNAVPIAFNASTICYNADIFEKYGLEIPETFEDLFAAADVMGKDDICVLGMVKKHMFLMLIAYYEQTTGRQAFSEDGQCLLGKEDISFLLDVYKEMLDRKVLLPIDEFDRNKFGKGDFAGSIFWVSDADNYCSVLESNGYTAYIGDYPMEEDAKLSGLYIKPATMYAISAITENPEEAAVFLDFLINDSDMVVLQGTEKGVPANDNAVNILEENNLLEGFGAKAYEKMEEHREIMNIMIPAMENEDAIQLFKDDADAYLYGVEEKEDTVEKIYSDLMEIYKK